MCTSSAPKASLPPPNIVTAASPYVSPEADPSSPNSTANAVSRKKLKVDLINSKLAPATGLGVPLDTSAKFSGVRG